ncbi:hypothetical protein SAMN05443254_103507 [Bradyrhizobium sp. OK095]|nr:hypothetical protein SAMN05443254_103507 [Bradyrhizobium sp. OK095]
MGIIMKPHPTWDTPKKLGIDGCRPSFKGAHVGRSQPRRTNEWKGRMTGRNAQG